MPPLRPAVWRRWAAGCVSGSLLAWLLLRFPDTARRSLGQTQSPS